MKKIGLMSDTHGDIPKSLYKYFKDVDEIWHAGDVGSVEVIDELEAFKPVRGVYGNIDDAKIRTIFPKTQEFECEGMLVNMIHIAGKPYKYTQDAYDLIQKNKPQIFVCGHSHILKVEFVKQAQMLWLNPGACGNKGFHKIKTLLRFSIDTGKVKDMEVIELGPR